MFNEYNYMGKWIGLNSPEINYPDCCDGCSNNPKNGGSGICNCTLPYMQNPTMYTSNASIDDCCTAGNPKREVFTVSEDFLDRVSKMNHCDIMASVERIKKYIKE